jgi:hypothetical protein
MNSYTLSIGDGSLLVGEGLQPPVFNDTDFQLERESRIRSGSYLETIATELDAIARATEDTAVTSNLQEIINELLYAQQRYHLTKKDHDRLIESL